MRMRDFACEYVFVRPVTLACETKRDLFDLDKKVALRSIAIALITDIHHKTSTDKTVSEKTTISTVFFLLNSLKNNFSL